MWARRWSLAIYVGSLAMMLGVSASYHRGTWGRRARAWWQRAAAASVPTQALPLTSLSADAQEILPLGAPERLLIDRKSVV